MFGWQNKFEECPAPSSTVSKCQAPRLKDLWGVYASKLGVRVDQQGQYRVSLEASAPHRLILDLQPMSSQLTAR